MVKTSKKKNSFRLTETGTGTDSKKAQHRSLRKIKRGKEMKRKQEEK